MAVDNGERWLREMLLSCEEDDDGFNMYRCKCILKDKFVFWMDVYMSRHIMKGKIGIIIIIDGKAAHPNSQKATDPNLTLHTT